MVFKCGERIKGRKVKATEERNQTIGRTLGVSEAMVIIRYLNSDFSREFLTLVPVVGLSLGLRMLRSP